MEEEFNGRDVYFSMDYYEDGNALNLKERRLENDEEYKRRLDIEKREERRAKAKEKEELKLYEQLKKKFGK